MKRILTIAVLSLSTFAFAQGGTATDSKKAEPAKAEVKKTEPVKAEAKSTETKTEAKTEAKDAKAADSKNSKKATPVKEQKKATKEGSGRRVVNTTHAMVNVKK